jgi:regulatory protein
MKADSNSRDAAAIARLAAMDMLARREHSRHELQQKLAAKYPDFSVDEIIDPVLDRLQAENLQSDARFVEAFVRYRSSRGVGPLKISAELYPKKIDGDLMKQALAEAGDWQAICLDVLQKKFGNTAGAPLKDRMKHSRFLQQRGFTPEQIRQAFNLAGAEDDDY